MKVFFRFTSPAGPMIIKAGIGLTAHPSDIARICIADDVEWPAGCDYSAEVIDEIASTVDQMDVTIPPIAITVTEIEFCEISSSPNAFRRAAKSALKSLFDIRADWLQNNREQGVTPNA